MNKKILILGHSDSPPVRVIENMLPRLGFDYEIVIPMFGEELPDPASIHGTIVLGGVPGIYQWEELRWLKREIDWVEAFANTGKPVLGICLGCQMLAHIHGERVYMGHQGREFGFVDFDLHIEDDPIFGNELKGCHVMQDHGDTFTLEGDFIHIAEGNVYEHQAAKFGDKLYGVQFHPEVDERVVRRWYEKSRQRGRIPEGFITAEEMVKQAEEYLPCVHDWLEKFLSRLFA